jgi:hypothetical protein
MLETYTVMPVAENEERRRERFKNRLQPHDLLLSLSTSEKPQAFGPTAPGFSFVRLKVSS